MIDHIRLADGEQAAVEVLDTLRSLRQENPGLRMVFSGSIGLHHVLGSIRDGKMSSEPVNDMYPVEVPPLARRMRSSWRKIASMVRAFALRTDASRPRSSPRKPITSLSTSTTLWPVSGKKGLPAEPDTVRELVRAPPGRCQRPMGSRPLPDRIPAYYTKGKNAELVGLILDALAIAQEPMTVPQLQTRSILSPRNSTTRTSWCGSSG